MTLFPRPRYGSMNGPRGLVMHAEGEPWNQFEWILAGVVVAAGLVLLANEACRQWKLRLQRA